MINPIPPIPANEFDRLVQLSKYDLDYTDLKSHFKDLSKLAAKVAGTEISLINMIDSYTQWSVSSHGMQIDQMPREDSVCQYTLMEEDQFEVSNLHEDTRFKEKFYVKHEPKLKYYYGVPLKNGDGLNLGALCVLDTKTKEITPEKADLLKIIADEIVNRLNIIRTLQEMNEQVSSTREDQKRVAHDIRGPIAGIIGLAQVIKDQGNTNNLEEVLDFINLIHKSGKSLLELADDILSLEPKENNRSASASQNGFNLDLLAEKLEDMFSIQASNKNVNFTIQLNTKSHKIPFLRNKLLQIIGNLVSNAIKFTEPGGSVEVSLDLKVNATQKTLLIDVSDDGVGMSEKKIEEILEGKTSSSDGTSGEKGYAFGLNLVKHLVETMRGQLSINSSLGGGTKFSLNLPMD